MVLLQLVDTGLLLVRVLVDSRFAVELLNQFGQRFVGRRTALGSVVEAFVDTLNRFLVVDNWLERWLVFLFGDR